MSSSPSGAPQTPHAIRVPPRRLGARRDSDRSTEASSVRRATGVIPQIVAVVALLIADVLASGIWGVPALAGPRDPVEVARQQSDVPLGATSEVVRKRLKKDVEREQQARIRSAPDPVTRDRLKRELPALLDAVDQSYQDLAGPRTPYDVSILTGEFRAGAGEGLVRLADGTQDTYFLFTADKLWKVVTTVAPHLDFAGAALRMTMEFGKPYRVEFDAADAAQPPVRVQWRVKDQMWELADRRADYGCYTVLVAIASQFEERSQSRATASAGRKLDPLVQDAMEQDDSDDIDNIVDKLLKKK